MKEEKKKAIMDCTTFDELLDVEYGPMGSPERMKFEADAEAFCLAEKLKEQRRLAGLTQQELADKIEKSIESLKIEFVREVLSEQSFDTLTEWLNMHEEARYVASITSNEPELIEFKKDYKESIRKGLIRK